MNHNEWELLEISENIEQGDLISVEDDEGYSKLYVYVKSSGKLVYLKCPQTKEIRKFSAESLEEIDGEGYITGKYDK
ncbi:MAG: hypothetical protein QXL01_00270 [Thermoplasmatales archaeon]